MDRYIGLDAPASSCTPGVMTSKGKRVGTLGYRAKGYRWARGDGVRVKNRLKSQAKKAVLAEAKKHREYPLMKSCPGLGPVRTAELLPIVVTPFRFQSKRGFWAYCGLGIVTRSSSDRVRTRTGEWVKAEVKRTRGLNRNHNHTLKAICKGAATTVIGRSEDEPIYRRYRRLLKGGTKPNLAKLTIARQIASIVLAVWRTGEVYDPKRLEGASESG